MSLSLHDLCRHFGFMHPPFARSVASSAIFRHHSFAEALARIRLAIESKAPAALTAEPGLGKSTLFGVLSDELDKDRTRLVYSPVLGVPPVRPHRPARRALRRSRAAHRRPDREGDPRRARVLRQDRDPCPR
jgi:ATPase subunit of ABC transporter with duplicated ATPase domains